MDTMINSTLHHYRPIALAEDRSLFPLLLSHTLHLPPSPSPSHTTHTLSSPLPSHTTHTHPPPLTALHGLSQLQFHDGDHRGRVRLRPHPQTASDVGGRVQTTHGAVQRNGLNSGFTGMTSTGLTLPVISLLALAGV